MRSQNLRLSKVQRRRKIYLSKKSKQKDLTSNFSNASSIITSESIYDSSDDLVCTNCVERDYYLAQFCNELLFSPSSAIRHLEELIKNPEFPKGDLKPSELECTQSSLSVSVPVTTYTCVDCNPLDERSPPRQVNPPQQNYPSCHTETQNVTSGNYEKRRREIERDLIKNIYELVCDPKHISTENSPRVTKLYVSEMAIQRMENIEKINYISQIERIKLKLLQSYRAFESLDKYVRKAGNGAGVEVLETVPYLKKIKDLEKSLHIRS